METKPFQVIDYLENQEALDAYLEERDRIIAKWQPIEAPPPDFVEVIVFAPRETPPVFTAEKCGSGAGWRRCSGGVWAQKDDYFGDPDFTPTHWMALPEPPQK